MEKWGQQMNSSKGGIPFVQKSSIGWDRVYGALPSRRAYGAATVRRGSISEASNRGYGDPVSELRLVIRLRRAAEILEPPSLKALVHLVIETGEAHLTDVVLLAAADDRVEG